MPRNTDSCFIVEIFECWSDGVMEGEGGKDMTAKFNIIRHSQNVLKTYLLFYPLLWS